MITNVKKKNRQKTLKTETRKQISSCSWSAIEYEFQFFVSETRNAAECSFI